MGRQFDMDCELLDYWAKSREGDTIVAGWVDGQLDSRIMDGHLEWITYLTNSCLAHAPQRPPALRTSPLPIDLFAGGRAHGWLAQGIAGYVVGCLG